jgi:hypothetical protein
MTNQLPRIHSIEPCWFNGCDQPTVVGVCPSHYGLICAGCDDRAVRHCLDCINNTGDLAPVLCATCVHSSTGHNPPGQEHVFTGLQLLSDSDLDTRISNIGKDAVDGSSNHNGNS